MDEIAFPRLTEQTHRITSPGDIASFKVYVITSTGNEKGSNGHDHAAGGIAITRDRLDICEEAEEDRAALDADPSFSNRFEHGP